MKRTRYLNYFYTVWFIGFLLVGFVARTADRLSDVFLPSDSPFFANYYANDFLTWGVVIFLTVGILMANFLTSRVKEKFLYLSLFLLFFSGAIVLFSLRLYFQKYFHVEEWINPVSKLVEIWGWAWMIGIGWVFSNQQIEKKIESARF
jgi:hypothetical protein